MDFANRGANNNRPNNPQQPALRNETSSDAGTPKTQFSSFSGKSKRNMDLGKVSSVFVLIASSILVLVLIFGLIFTKKENTVNSEASLINTSQYQAVFLASQDGQVYFGKLDIYNKDMYVLKDIYYVRVENPIQPEGQNQQSQANISLAKLGNELHAPEDVMYIAREKVLYWENLKDDGQVVSAIKKYQTDGGQSNDATDTTQQNTNPSNANDTQESNSNANQDNDTTTP